MGELLTSGKMAELNCVTKKTLAGAKDVEYVDYH